MPRKSWQSLSDSYRKRLERNGVSRSAYESGASLSAARGHRATPERPKSALTAPDKYTSYWDRLLPIKRTSREGQSRIVLETTEGLKRFTHVRRRDNSLLGSLANAQKNALYAGRETDRLFPYGKPFGSLPSTRFYGIEEGETKPRWYSAETDRRRLVAIANVRDPDDVGFYRE